MAYRAVLDACVLFPFSLRDTLLRLAEVELYDPLWSDRILEEMKRNVLAERAEVTEAQMERMVGLMNGAFEDALVEADAIATLVDSMTNDPKDRHVLAAALAAGADGIVTDNLADFPPAACEPFGITVASADEFLCVLADMDEGAVKESLVRQADALKNPPQSPSELLDVLERAGAADFAKRLREAI